MDILAKFNDEELTKLPFGLTRTQVFKLRKGLMTLADVDPDLERKLLDRYTDVGSEAEKMDYDNPDYSHPGFATYDSRFRESVEANGLTAAYEGWTRSVACGCMGEQDGEPFCPCAMNHLIANRYAKQQIIPTEEGAALLASVGAT